MLGRCPVSSVIRWSGQVLSQNKCFAKPVALYSSGAIYGTHSSCISRDNTASNGSAGQTGAARATTSDSRAR